MRLERWPWFSVWVALLASSAACGGEDGDGATRSDGLGGAEPATGGGAAVTGGTSTGGAPTGGVAGAGPAGPLWTSESASIEVTSWGAMDGIYWTFAATRAELTAEQLELLAGLELIEPTLPPASCDLPSFSVRITDGRGVAVSYSVTDPSCTNRPLISFSSFLPFQETLGCDPFPAGLFFLELEYADPVGPSRCQYRFYPGHFDGELAWMLLRVPEPGSCRITTLGLELDLVLYDPTGSQALASATTPAGEDAAYVLDQDFAAAGDYPVSFQAVDPEETTPGSIAFTCE